MMLRVSVAMTILVILLGVRKNLEKRIMEKEKARISKRSSERHH